MWMMRTLQRDRFICISIDFYGQFCVKDPASRSFPLCSRPGFFDDGVSKRCIYSRPGQTLAEVSFLQYHN